MNDFLHQNRYRIARRLRHEMKRKRKLGIKYRLESKFYCFEEEWREKYIEDFMGRFRLAVILDNS